MRPSAIIKAAIIGLSGLLTINAHADTVAAGKKLAEQNCARCHAIDHTGASPHDQAPPFRELTARYDVWGLQEALAEGILTGHPDMPQFTFEPEEITALLTFLENLGTASPKN